MYWIIKWWAFIFLRLYFRKTIVSGLDKVPKNGPLIVASNHPSAFLEASILATNLKRNIHFLVRGDMFHPRFRWLFDWTNQIPIYRQKDGIANLRKNASSFDLTYRKLAKGEAVLIFPEAKTTLEKKMRPIQRGTAHLAFGTMPFLKGDDTLFVIPVGVNFTEPRIPGTDVVVKFGEPFITQNASREDREAIEEFTEQLSGAMSPLIIQVEDAYEKNYDLLASIYLRMVYENRANADAHGDLRKIAALVNVHASNASILLQTSDVIKTLNSHEIQSAMYFPDLIVLNKVGLSMMTILKITWLIAGGWIWRVVRNFVFKKIKTNTFQGPTTVGIFMVVMPLVTIILICISLITGLPIFYVGIWLLVMWLGSFIRPPLHLIWRMLMLSKAIKTKLKRDIIEMREGLEKGIKGAMYQGIKG
jgi:1-acyl-sn-glycerol-3-phosphate acyltransferase